ncbi:class F sortase [Paenibacillus sp. J5C_2022]|uniref:class F sortase n=1 Tax=Paenibacillus sp. J5C2022 TaxID=2977129 RepID=UPI0021D20B17|nr:class F sortase [Paenibacillus sp. J5C2022]MCU6713283.1 class F sortase [Paenibacillus sp. J5C2022]
MKNIFSLIIIIVLIVTSGCGMTPLPPKPDDVNQTPFPIPQIIKMNPPQINAEQENIKITKSAVHLPIVPNYLSIPAIDLKAQVVPVGIKDSGQMEVPKSSEVVGFLNDGINPGDEGNAIFTRQLISELIHFPFSYFSITLFSRDISSHFTTRPMHVYVFGWRAFAHGYPIIIQLKGETCTYCFCEPLVNSLTSFSNHRDS